MAYRVRVGMNGDFRDMNAKNPMKKEEYLNRINAGKDKIGMSYWEKTVRLISSWDIITIRIVACTMSILITREACMEYIYLQPMN